MDPPSPPGLGRPEAGHPRIVGHPPYRRSALLSPSPRASQNLSASVYTSRSLSPHPQSHRVETAWPLSVGSTHFAPIHMPAYGSTGGPQTPSREGRSQQRPIDETRDTENEVRNNRSQADPDQPLDCGARKAGARRLPLPLSPPEPTRARGRSESGRSAYVTTANNARVSHLQT